MVHLHAPGCPVGYTGLTAGVGSRNESPDQHGLAHFVEHTIFKGTARRSSWHIINRMESVGGELNAFTTKEETTVYAAFPGNNPSRAAELIADLTANSRFPLRELAKEREVVADEIDSYLDSPADAVFDDFEDLLFAGSGLGHNILGTRAHLATFTPEVCRDYLRRYYTPSNMVAFYAGAMSAERAFAILERLYVYPDRPDTRPATPPSPPAVTPFDIHRPIESHQAHTVTGWRVGGLDSHQRYAVALLANILGGPGMNSLLNLALRERRGLVYNVEATTGIFTDCGELLVYYGCDPADTALCRRLVADTIADVATGYITPRRLQAAKRQYLGQLRLSSVNLEARITGAARSVLRLGTPPSAAATAAAIDAVTADSIQAIARDLASTPSTLTLGPRSSHEEE